MKKPEISLENASRRLWLDVKECLHQSGTTLRKECDKASIKYETTRSALHGIGAGKKGRHALAHFKKLIQKL